MKFYLPVWMSPNGGADSNLAGLGGLFGTAVRGPLGIFVGGFSRSGLAKKIQTGDAGGPEARR
jgi:hypothetical protein